MSGSEKPPRLVTAIRDLSKKIVPSRDQSLPALRLSNATVVAVDGSGNVTVQLGEGQATGRSLVPVGPGDLVKVFRDGVRVVVAGKVSGWQEGDSGVLYDDRADGGNTNMSAGPIVGAWADLTVPPSWSTFRIQAVTTASVTYGAGAPGTYRPLFDHEWKLDGVAQTRLAEELFLGQGRYEQDMQQGRHLLTWSDTRGPTPRPAGGLVEVRYWVYNLEAVNTTTIAVDNVTTAVTLHRAS